MNANFAAFDVIGLWPRTSNAYDSAFARVGYDENTYRSSFIVVASACIAGYNYTAEVVGGWTVRERDGKCKPVVR